MRIQFVHDARQCVARPQHICIALLRSSFPLRYTAWQWGVRRIYSHAAEYLSVTMRGDTREMASSVDRVGRCASCSHLSLELPRTWQA